MEGGFWADEEAKGAAVVCGVVVVESEWVEEQVDGLWVRPALLSTNACLATTRSASGDCARCYRFPPR